MNNAYMIYQAERTMTAAEQRARLADHHALPSLSRPGLAALRSGQRSTPVACSIADAGAFRLSSPVSIS